MSQWKQRHLPFVLGGDALPATYFANWILNEPQPEWMPHTYQSDIHKTVIDVRACGAFLVADENPETHQRKQFLRYTDQIRVIATGTGRLWDTNCRDMLPLRKYVQDNWLKIATNSQLAERWVKDSNECTATCKDEKMSNIYAIIRSRTVMSFNNAATEEHKNRI